VGGGGAYIRKMPKVVGGIGAFSAAEMPSARAARVSTGSRMPSSRSRDGKTVAELARTAFGRDR
jgi:hypothetical protein